MCLKHNNIINALQVHKLQSETTSISKPVNIYGNKRESECTIASCGHT